MEIKPDEATSAERDRFKRSDEEGRAKEEEEEEEEEDWWVGVVRLLFIVGVEVDVAEGAAWRIIASGTLKEDVFCFLVGCGVVTGRVWLISMLSTKTGQTRKTR